MKSISNRKPSEIRLSPNFLLSDFMGCNSVYSKGLANVFHDLSGQKLKEGTALCDYVLEALLEKSQLSISYGYISPDLSESIVTYMDPGRPSYHRWDKGAACDVLLHDLIREGTPPIDIAFLIDDTLPMSRTITYSESPYICVATKLSEIDSGKVRKALYENRYEGVRRPLYVVYSNNLDIRDMQRRQHKLEHDWRGAGYPTYHGGGKRQLHHIRTSKYTMLSDFLYSDYAVANGIANRPSRLDYSKFRAVGDVYDTLVIELLHDYGIGRLPIVRGYESGAWSSSEHVWGNLAKVSIALPEDYEPDGLFSTLEEWGDTVPYRKYCTVSRLFTFGVDIQAYARM